MKMVDYFELGVGTLGVRHAVAVTNKSAVSQFLMMLLFTLINV